MSAQTLASRLLGEGVQTEATVRLPPKGHRWIGIFTGPEPGQQIARGTGLTDREAALALTQRWECDSLRQRRARWKARQRIEPTAERLPGFSQAEVAALLGLSQRAVRAIERRAILKLRGHPVLRQLWADVESLRVYVADLDASDLTGPEVAALLPLASDHSNARRC